LTGRARRSSQEVHGNSGEAAGIRSTVSCVVRHFFISDSKGGATHRQSLEETLLEAPTDWGGGSPPSKTTTISIQIKMYWNGLDDRIFICWNGPVKVQKEGQKIDVLHLLTELKLFCNKNEQTFQCLEMQEW
ncbi:hypothetical protein AMECASPLE_007435, partial [Ameca splendens]